MKQRNWLYYLYCALGEKSKEDVQEADRVAFIRLLMFLSILITNGFIVANAIRHWNDSNESVKCIITTK